MTTTPARSIPVTVSSNGANRFDLAGLAVHRELPEHDPGVLIDHREQAPSMAGSPGVPVVVALIRWALIGRSFRAVGPGAPGVADR